MKINSCFLATKLAVKHALSVSCALKIEKCAKSDDCYESKTYEDAVWGLTYYIFMMCLEILRHCD